MELQAELLSTIHEFEIDGEKSRYKYLKLKEDFGKDFSTTFFAAMQTPDTIATTEGEAVGD